ncbi:hypothetical protein BDN72DRAFT_964282 [Pluteus cervinus]|uniref:Uncharacterized protein n=1 Tax=Pluteus cervinus TaxID=181527 RepID=A0ACD3AB21_9AGAR|nr:hypothetical protein BDN72DRAFT_964282 [Pluteus cervinus]
MSTSSPPIHEKIPQELMSQIFCEVYSEASKQLVPPVNLVPLTLGLVCRAWRHITLATASLWTCIETGSISSIGVETISAWLQRSKALPCCIKIRIYFQTSESPTTLLDVVLPVLSRLHTLHLLVPRDMIAGFIESHPLDMPQLNQLTIQQVGPDRNPKVVSIIPHPNAFSSCASLRRLTLKYAHGLGLYRDPSIFHGRSSPS